MSKSVDRLDVAYAEFNQNYAKLRRYIKKELRKEEKPSPEGEAVLELLDNVDAVLDEVVSNVRRLEKKIKNPQ